MSVKESDKSNVVQSIDNDDLEDVKTNVTDYQLQVIERFEAESKLEKNISIESNPIVNLESITVVLLDTDLKSVQQFVENVRNIIDYIQVFDDPVKCEAYIRQIKYEVVLFIVSSHIVTPIISNIHDLQQLHTIYVYNHSQTMIEEDDRTEMNYRKIGGLFIDSNQVSQYLGLNVSILVKNLASIPELLFEGTVVEHTVIEESCHYHVQPFTRLLLDLPVNSERGKQKLIKYMKTYYKDNRSEMKKILDFEENYKSYDAINWYTRDSFIFRILNKALRLQNYEIIFLFRFFIVDLWNQIECENWKYFQDYNDFPIVCYRGQMMVKSEVENLKKLNTVCLNTFLSTSRNRDVALMFTNQVHTHRENDLQSVLFVITIEHWEKDCSTPLFVDISRFSGFPTEEETLFMVGTEFTIMSIEFDQTKMLWIINLKLQQIPLWSLFTDDNGNISVLQCGISLFDHDEHKNTSIAEKYFTAVLNEFHSSDLYVFACYTGLSFIALASKNYDLALEYFHKCLDIERNNPNTIFKLTSLLFCFIGTVYRERKDYNVALDWYEKALKSKFTCHLKYCLPKQYLFNDYPLFNIAFLYRIKGDIDLAWKYFQKFIENKSNIDQVDEINAYEIISNVFTDNVNFDMNMEQTRTFLNTSFEYMIKHNSNTVICAYELLAIKYFDNKSYKLSLELFSVQQLLLLKYGSNEYGQIARNYQWIAKTYRKIGDIDMVIKSYKQALELIVVYLSTFHEIADIFICFDYYETLRFYLNDKANNLNHVEIESIYENIQKHYNLKSSQLQFIRNLANVYTVHHD